MLAFRLSRAFSSLGYGKLSSPSLRLLQSVNQNALGASTIVTTFDDRHFLKPSKTELKPIRLHHLSAPQRKAIGQALQQISDRPITSGLIAKSGLFKNTHLSSQALIPVAFDHQPAVYNFGPMLINLWTMILFGNLVGLAGYAIGPTLHLAIVFPAALSFWMSIIASSIKHSPNDFLAHLVPPGSPMVLAPFMCVIEAVSIAIRPITLSVRLVANLSAGHLIMGLIGGGVVAGGLATQSLALGVNTFYAAFEVFVGCIQTYIFCNLLSLYAEEHS